MKILACTKVSSSVCFSANLSRDYFTDRQDRYVRFTHCTDLAEYFSGLLETIASHSFSLLPDGGTSPPGSAPADPLSSRRAARDYRDCLHDAVAPFVRPQSNESGDESRDLLQTRSPEQLDGSKPDTVVFPLLQMGYYDIRQEEAATRLLLEQVKEGEEVCLASGYFNLPRQYIGALLQADGGFNVLAASPQVQPIVTDTRVYVV